MAIRKAEKRQSKLRLALIGPTGSGKTYSALAIASGLCGKVGVIDTERKSADLYADTFAFDVESDLQSFSPQTYIETIGEFARQGYDVLVIDSLSHAWSGQGGALEMVDEAAKRNKTGSSFAGWRDVTPIHNRMVDAILNYPGHVIVTVRSKMEYIQERDERGKTTIRKVGLQPVQRDGLEYEFTVVGEMTADHDLVITKSRCSALADGIFKRPGRDVAELLKKWLNDGAAPPARASAEQVETIKSLLAAVHLPEGTTEKWFAKANVTRWEDMPADVVVKCIDHVKRRLPSNAPADQGTPQRPVPGGLATGDPTDLSDAGFLEACAVAAPDVGVTELIESIQRYAKRLHPDAPLAADQALTPEERAEVIAALRERRFDFDAAEPKAAA